MTDDWAALTAEATRRLAMGFGVGALARFLLNAENWDVLPSYRATWEEQLRARFLLQGQFVRTFGPTGFARPAPSGLVP